MRPLHSFDDANKVLTEFAPPPITTGATLILDRMRTLLKFLGNPQNNYKVIHIAGTSGKTSTAYYMAAFLQAAGQKAGLTISPHVDEVNERVQINLEPLDEKVFVNKLSEFLDIIDQSSIKPTYFELLVAMAFWHFAEAKVDYAVVEVGLGGLMDATNVIDRKDKIAVITDIGLDHTQALGNTLPKIATQKAGIINPGNDIFSYQQGEDVMAVFRDTAKKQNATLHELNVESDPLARDLPLFQQRNWQLAKKVYEYIAQKNNLPSLTPDQQRLASRTKIPARMETLRIGEKILIMDGAHNAQKMKALTESVRQIHEKQEISTLISFVDNKDFHTAMTEVVSISSYLIITAFTRYQDMKRGSVDPEAIAARCRELGFEKFTVIADPVDAFHTLLKRPEPILLITGSFYLLNHIRPLIKKEALDRPPEY